MEIIVIEQQFIQAKHGDKQAFSALYEELLKPVYRFILLRVRNKEVAEDLTQQVFLKALEALPKSSTKTISPAAYFLTAARNTVIDHWRKKKHPLVGNPEEVFENIPSHVPNAEQSIIEEEKLTDIMAAMSNLNDDQREVLILKFVNEQSNTEIAKILNKSEEAVRQIQSRALKLLRQKMIQTI